MANKGGSGHIKRLYAPRYFGIHKKEHKYVVKQNPGRHSLGKSVALTLIVSRLGISTMRSESDSIIRSGLVSVNGKVVKEPKFPIGLSDIVTVGKENRIIGINKNGQISISESKGDTKQFYKIVGKYKDKKGRIMLRLHDGRSIAGSKDAMVNDSVVLEGNAISKVVKLGVDAKCEVIDGVHIGATGTVKEIIDGNAHKQKSLKVEEQNGHGFETLVRNIIVME